jgi:hypothetical protein
VDWATLAGGVHNNATNGRHRDTRTYINRHIYTCKYPYDADGARRQCRAAAQADGGRRARGLSRALRGTARVCNDVRVLQGHSRVLTGTPRYSNGTRGYSHRTVQLAAHQQRSLRLERPHACDAAGTARQALHGRHCTAVLKEYHVSHEPCSTNSKCGPATRRRAERRTPWFVHLGTYGYSTVLTRSVRAPPGTEGEEAHVPIAPRAARVCRQCACAACRVE